jgi:hypothetical protein
MIEIIPISPENNFTISDENIKTINSKECFCVSVSLISKLLVIDNYPIKNKRLSIINILNFLRYIDCYYKDESSLITIHSNTLKKILTNHYPEYLKILSDLEVITRVPHENGMFYSYKLDKFSCLYRLHNKYINDNEFCIVYIDNNHKRNKIEISSNINFKLDNRFIKTIDKVEVNYKKAIEAEIEYYFEEGLEISVLRKRISKLFSIKNNRYIKKGIKVDRLYHSLCSLTRISRKHLNINFTNIDLVNTQPVLLAFHLIDNNINVDKNYLDDCEIGQFYENFYQLSKFKSIDRKRAQVKEKLYQTVFFKFIVESKYNKLFKELYPITWEYLNSIKEIVSLATILQNKEAECFNNITPKYSKYFFTLFDAVYFDDNRDINIIVEQINNFFKRNIKLKIELNNEI